MTEFFPLTVVKNDFSRLNKLLYGFPKAGKTTLCTHMISNDGRKPMFISTEDGNGILEYHSRRITTWEGFCRLVDEVIMKNATDIQKRFSTIVVDHLTDLDDMCTNYITSKYGVTYLGDLPHGKGWSEQSKELKKYLSKLFEVLPVTFISHAVDKTVKVEGNDVNIQVPAMNKKTLHYINAKVDAIMFIIPQAHGKKPRITMIQSLTCIAGSRYPQINKDYTLDITNVGDVYKNIQQAFEGRK